MNGIEGRTVVITGAGRGIGAAVARVLAREGARIVVNDVGASMDGKSVDGSPAQTVVDEIRAAGGEAVLNGSDITSYKAADELVQQAIDTYGGLDVLINVAGILRDRMIFNLDEEDWDAVIDVHLKGTFNTTRHAAKYWHDLRNPDANNRIINFTSGAGLHGAPGQPNYAAAKMGIVGLTYSCANSLGRYGVTANAIAPAALTRMMDTVPDDNIPQNVRDGGDPENVVPVVAYIASEQSGWCTGQVLSARGLDIGLYNVPQVIRMLSSAEPWDLDTAFGLIERVFRPAVLGDHPSPSGR